MEGNMGLLCGCASVVVAPLYLLEQILWLLDTRLNAEHVQQEKQNVEDTGRVAQPSMFGGFKWERGVIILKTQHIKTMVEGEFAFVCDGKTALLLF